MTQKVPVSWSVKSLGEVIDIKGGSQPPKSQFVYEPQDGYIQLLQIRDFGNKPVPTYVPKEKVTKFCEKNDVLIARYGASLGRIVTGHAGAYNVALAKVIPWAGLFTNRYLYYLLQTSVFQTPLKMISRSAQNGFAKHEVAHAQLPIPPLNEQHRIVAKIEELFSELDKGIESLKSAREQLKVYRQSLLKHAFEGKLTEQWRKDNADKLETADQLLERIKQEREARYQQQLEDWKVAVKQWDAGGKVGKRPAKPKANKKLACPSSDESKGYENIPDSWRMVKIGDISSVGTGVTPLKGQSKYYESGEVAWVTSGALNQPFVTEASGYVTELALDETNLRLYPKHTLLMAMYGEGKTRGKSSELLFSATTNQAIAAMVQCGIEEYTRPYLKLFLMKNYSDIRRKSSGGVQPNLNLGIVENTALPLCSLDEMEVIVNELESKLSVLYDTESMLTDQLLKSEALRQSILKKAFSGQLVPQDPNDEPASALLERIAKEKAEADAKAKLAKAAKKNSKPTKASTRKAS